jgi:hypothetical protein
MAVGLYDTGPNVLIRWRIAVICGISL